MGVGCGVGLGVGAGVGGVVGAIVGVCVGDVVGVLVGVCVGGVVGESAGLFLRDQPFGVGIRINRVVRSKAIISTQTDYNRAFQNKNTPLLGITYNGFVQFRTALMEGFIAKLCQQHFKTQM